jgi:hypothetical protein
MFDKTVDLDCSFGAGLNMRPRLKRSDSAPGGEQRIIQLEIQDQSGNYVNAGRAVSMPRIMLMGEKIQAVCHLNTERGKSGQTWPGR